MNNRALTATKAAAEILGFPLGHSSAARSIQPWVSSPRENNNIFSGVSSMEGSHAA